MKVLLDECVPARLATYLFGHEVKTTEQMGWLTLQNGALLRAAQEHFDVFLTLDKGVPHQNPIPKLNIAVLVVRCNRNAIEFILPFVPDILVALPELKPGTHVTVGKAGRQQT